MDGTSIIAAFHQPDLQVATHPMCAIRDRFLLAGVDYRHLFPKCSNAKLVGRLLGQWRIGLVCGRFVFSVHWSPRVAIVETMVVIVFLPIGGDLREQIHKATLTKLFVPLSPQFFLCARTCRDGMIVIDVVAGPNEEVRSHFEDRGQGGIAQIFVRPGIHVLTRTIHPIMKSRVGHARHDDEAGGGAYLWPG